jgi:hypothetical protein
VLFAQLFRPSSRRLRRTRLLRFTSRPSLQLPPMLHRSRTS